MKERTATPEHIDQKTTEHGWFRESLFSIDAALYGRWGYWCDILLAGTIGPPENKIPRIDFGMIGSGGGPPDILASRSEGIRQEIGSREDARRNCERRMAFQVELAKVSRPMPESLEA